jgi:predicted metal-dependent hydrolase
MPEIQFENQTIVYTLQKSRRARRISLKIDAEKGLRVIIPSQTQVDVENILYEKQAWIQKHLARFAPRRQYISGETLPLYGIDSLLQVTASPETRRVSVSHKNEVFLVKIPAALKPAARRETVRSTLENWYRREANQHIPQETAQIARQLGFSYQAITIRGQKTRWGSCSSRGNLNFNWRLIMAPHSAIEYVIIHELCHLKVPNHSDQFWSLVAQYCPDYPTYVNWLRKHAQLYNLI